MLPAPRRHARRAWAERGCAHLVRAHFAARPTTPASCESSFRYAHEDVRDVHGLGDALAQCPAKERGTGQQRGDAKGKRQGGYNTAAYIARAARHLRCRVCCGDGVGSTGRAARPRVRRSHNLTFTYNWLTCISSIDRHDDGQDVGMSRRADAPASTSSRALIERVHTPCRTH